MELNSHVAELLIAFLDIDTKTKESVDFSYVNLDAKLRRSRIEEKKLITDYLKNMDNEERRVEDTKKALKLGRWNVGMQKGLVNYDDATYERERNEMIARMSNEGAIEDESNLIGLRDVEDLEREGVEGEDGDFGIDGLDEDYNDGVYYPEDADP
jgi:xylose isomerase